MRFDNEIQSWASRCALRARISCPTAPLIRRGSDGSRGLKGIEDFLARRRDGARLHATAARFLVRRRLARQRRTRISPSFNRPPLREHGVLRDQRPSSPGFRSDGPRILKSLNGSGRQPSHSERSVRTPLLCRWRRDSGRGQLASCGSGRSVLDGDNGLLVNAGERHADGRPPSCRILDTTTSPAPSRDGRARIRPGPLLDDAASSKSTARVYEEDQRVNGGRGKVTTLDADPEQRCAAAGLLLSSDERMPPRRRFDLRRVRPPPLRPSPPRPALRPSTSAKELGVRPGSIELEYEDRRGSSPRCRKN
jgi:hypothetical protein